MRELEVIKKRKDQMYKLCDAAATGDGNSGMPSAEVLSANVNQRLREYQYFQRYRQELDNLLSHLSSVQVHGTQCVPCSNPKCQFM